MKNGLVKRQSTSLRKTEEKLPSPWFKKSYLPDKLKNKKGIKKFILFLMAFLLGVSITSVVFINLNKKDAKEIAQEESNLVEQISYNEEREYASEKATTKQQTDSHFENVIFAEEGTQLTGNDWCLIVFSIMIIAFEITMIVGIIRYNLKHFGKAFLSGDEIYMLEH